MGLLIAGGLLLGAKSLLDKEDEKNEKKKSAIQEQQFRKAIAPTMGYTDQYQGPVNMSEIKGPSALAELGGGAMTGAAIQQGMDNSNAYNALLQEKTKQMQLENAAMAPQAIAAESPDVYGPKQGVVQPTTLQPQGAISPDMQMYLNTQGDKMGPKEMARWQALYSQMGNTRNG